MRERTMINRRHFAIRTAGTLGPLAISPASALAEQLNATVALSSSLDRELTERGAQSLGVQGDPVSALDYDYDEASAHKWLGTPVDTDPRDYKVSFGKVKRTLGYKPLWSLEEGVKQVIDAIETGRVKDYSDARHNNVKFFRDEGASRLIPRRNGWAHDLIKETSPGAARVPATTTSIAVDEI